jgi:hypothetical protein
MKLTAFAFAAGLLLALSTVTMGLASDDYVQVARVRGALPEDLLGSRWDLFRFSPGAEKQHALIQRGFYPWWMSPDGKGALFRPLSSALTNFDVRVLGDHVVLWHLHSVAWYLLLLAVALLLYRRVLPQGAAPLALLFFAIDDSHWMPVAWLANRNSLLSTTLGMLGLLLHLKWREDGWRPGAVLSPLACAAALCGGEAALGAIGFIVMYELLNVKGEPWPRRVAALGPLAFVGVLYVVAYRVGDYGTTSSTIYLDPLREPALFLAALPQRFLVMMSSFTLGVGCDIWLFLGTHARWGLAGIGLFGLLNWALWLSRGRPAWNDPEWRRLRWLIVSALVAVVPVTASIPADRHLIVSSVAGAGLVAALLRALWPLRTFVPRGAKLVLVTMMGLAPLPGWVVGPAWFGANARFVEKGVADLSVAAEENVVMPLAPDPLVAVSTVPWRSIKGWPLPRSWSVLSFAPYAHRLKRTGEQTYELEVVGGSMFGSVFEQLFRDPRRPLQQGDVVSIEAITVTVLDASEGRATRIGFETKKPVVFVRWREGRLERLEPPPVGGFVDLPHEETPFEMISKLATGRTPS